MEFGMINQRLTEALNEVLTNDPHLLEHDINEPSISHRLALYLEDKFPDFNVDCEYNGNVDDDSDRKYIYILKERAEQLGMLRKGEEDDEILYRCVYPDIIVHKRGGNDNNLLIIEVKKSSNQNNGDWDGEKLSRFTSSENENNFNYQYGLFVRFVVGDAPSYSVQWYQNGLAF